jgi:perosamine synthetase
MIPYGKHSINDNDIKSVVKVLKSNNLTQGPIIQKFEKKFSKFVGSKYSILVSSCTAGLHLSNIAIGLKKNEKFISSMITFVSSINSALYVGGRPILCDIDIDNLNISIDDLKKKLNKYKNIKSFVPVHFTGKVFELNKIYQFLKKNKISVIEDAAHALGSKYSSGEMVGSCKYSDLCVFSLHPVKIIAAGEGGVITTNNKSLYEKLLRLRSHGINKYPNKLINKSSYENNNAKPWVYEMQELGYHYRITDIQAALALSQLTRVNKFVKKRQYLARYYFQKLKNNKYVRPFQNYDKNSSYHIFVVKILFEKLNITRSQLMTMLRSKKIITQVHYIPIMEHPFFKYLKLKSKNYKYSYQYYNHCLTLPLFFDLSTKQVDLIVDEINTIITDYKK